MSLIHILELLSQDDLVLIDALFEKSEFVDGSKTASLAAKAVKNNLQIDVNDINTLLEMQNIISIALQTNPLFQISALPRHLYPILFSKYYEGMTYGWHVDSPAMGSPAIITDLAMTFFLSAPVHILSKIPLDKKIFFLPLNKNTIKIFYCIFPNNFRKTHEN
jgi:PKHD-type hydroxylase